MSPERRNSWRGRAECTPEVAEFTGDTWRKRRRAREQTAAVMPVTALGRRAWSPSLASLVLALVGLGLPARGFASTASSLCTFATTLDELGAGSHEVSVTVSNTFDGVPPADTHCPNGECWRCAVSHGYFVIRCQQDHGASCVALA